MPVHNNIDTGSKNPKTRAREGGASVFTALFSSFYISVPPSARSKNFRAKPKQAGKKKGGLGEGIFARLLCPPKAGWGWESVSAIPLARGRQNRKIFVSLIEKIFGGRRLKKCRENFSVLLPPLAEAETLGGIQSAKSSGFCSKKVRILTKRHRKI